MVALDTDGVRAPVETNRASKFYFAAWRWHFYAGLYVAPFLVMLATTGLLMLYAAAFLGRNGERMTVPVTGSPEATSTLATVAISAVPGGTVTQYLEPLNPSHVAVFRVDVGDVATAVQINPFTGEVLGTSPWGGGLYDLANKIHGTLMIGTLGDRLIEIAAGFGILLLITGLYLWWPRNGQRLGGLLVPNLTARGRTLWKSLHQSIGFWVSAVLLVFLVSGMSWTGVWGEKFVQAWNTFPAEKWNNVPLSDATHASMNHDGMKEVPWGLEETPMPMSGSDAGAEGISGAVTLDSIVDYARSLGFVGRFQLNLPADESGVWTISHDSMSKDGPNPPSDRTIHIDQYTGKVLADVRYSDYSPYAKAMAWGIAFHEGDMGDWNLAFNTLFCLSVIFLSVSGLVMWWKRRPAGALRLAAPPMPLDLPLWKGAVFVALLLSLVFPLVGLTLLGLLAIDLLLLANVPALRRLVS